MVTKRYNFDVAAANAFSNNVSILRNKGNSTFAVAVNYMVGSLPESICSVDFDATGSPDLAITNFTSDSISILHNNGGGTFAPAVNYQVGTGPNSVCAADLDGDGRPDLAVANRTSGTVTILFAWHCCQGSRGNVNGAGVVDLGDLSALVSYLTGGGFVLPCPASANVNGSGAIDLGDLSALVSYLTGGGFVLPACP